MGDGGTVVVGGKTSTQYTTSTRCKTDVKYDPKKPQTGPFDPRVTVQDKGNRLIFTAQKKDLDWAQFRYDRCKDSGSNSGCNTGNCSGWSRFWNGTKNFFCKLGKGLFNGVVGIGKGIGGILGGGIKLAGGLLSGIGSGLSNAGALCLSGGFGGGMGFGFNPMMMMGGGFGCMPMGGMMGGFGLGMPMFGCNPFAGLFRGHGCNHINISMARPPMIHHGGFRPMPMLHAGFGPHHGGHGFHGGHHGGHVRFC